MLEVVGTFSCPELWHKRADCSVETRNGPRRDLAQEGLEFLCDRGPHGGTEVGRGEQRLREVGGQLRQQVVEALMEAPQRGLDIVSAAAYEAIAQTQRLAAAHIVHQLKLGDLAHFPPRYWGTALGA
jgi:hypothetical protein